MTQLIVLFIRPEDHPAASTVVLLSAGLSANSAGELSMKTKYTVAFSLLAGVAIGGLAVQGLHAQASKLKAYSINEAEALDSSALNAYLPGVREAISQHHGKSLRTIAGRIVQVEGAAPPKNVAMVEWDSVDDALAFYKSDVWKASQAQRDKAYKVIRRYIVETEK
jgi:uncharacterized protein (DUF1330 family)